MGDRVVWGGGYLLLKKHGLDISSKQRLKSTR